MLQHGPNTQAWQIHTGLLGAAPTEIWTCCMGLQRLNPLRQEERGRRFLPRKRNVGGGTEGEQCAHLADWLRGAVELGMADDAGVQFTSCNIRRAGSTSGGR